jgi:hypothetical protein
MSCHYMQSEGKCILFYSLDFCVAVGRLAFSSFDVLLLIQDK